MLKALLTGLYLLGLSSFANLVEVSSHVKKEIQKLLGSVCVNVEEFSTKDIIYQPAVPIASFICRASYATVGQHSKHTTSVLINHETQSILWV